jgi:2-dehydropantoate 2-reductase
MDWRRVLRIVVVGAGVQGTVFAVRLAMAGHEVTLVASLARVIELGREGATIQNVKNGQICSKALPVLEKLPPGFAAEMCLVTVRREQIEAVLPELVHATAIPRVVFLVNHANGSSGMRTQLGSRLVLAFPGTAGDRVGGIVRYFDIPQQRTVVEEGAHDVIALFREAGFAVDRVRDMDGWLQRHAVFITAIAGALCEYGCHALRLAQNPDAVRRLIVAVREGWTAQDRVRVRAAPFMLRAILCWVPLPLSTTYWSRLLGSPRGDLYFARHVRHAPAEMAALAQDVRNFLAEGEALGLRALLASIDAWRGRFAAGAKPRPTS